MYLRLRWPRIGCSRGQNVLEQFRPDVDAQLPDGRRHDPYTGLWRFAPGSGATSRWDIHPRLEMDTQGLDADVVDDRLILTDGYATTVISTGTDPQLRRRAADVLHRIATAATELAGRLR